MRTHGILVFLLVIGLGCLSATEKAIPVPDVPPEFSFVGTYQLVKRVKMRGGKPFNIAIPRVSYFVYSDGITLRFYGEAGGTSHTSFEIYRSDGVARQRENNVLANVPGVQAKSTVGRVLRQVTLTERTMTLTKFPALSDAVEITYAMRVVETDRLEASHPPLAP